MTTGTGRAFRDGQHHLMQPGRPTTFNAEQILFREVTGSTGNAWYSDIRAPVNFRGDDEFEALLRRLAKDDNFPTGRDRPEAVKLDLPIYRETYVVLRLAKESMMVFVNEPAAVTLGSPSSNPAAYGGLRHVRPNGQISMDFFEGCRLVFFSALFRPGQADRPHRQSLNFNARDKRGSFVPIDPDIRHPGTGGAIPEDPGG